MKFPKNVRKGDKIAVVSPAGAVEESQLAPTLSLIESHGYQPVLGNHVYGKYDHGFVYSGTEQQRIADLNWALNDPEIAAVWASRGGYGCQHLVQHLDWSFISKNPKWYIGYSDNTVIQSGLLKNEIPSIHGQTIKTSSFGVSEESYQHIFDILRGNIPQYTIQNHPYNRVGETEGILVGGNLALIYALLGTENSFDFQDKILFIEEIGEQYYALDRMLMSLEMGGVFNKIKGLVVGGMTNMGKEADNQHYTESFDPFANQLIMERVQSYHFPVVFQFPNGHIEHNLPLIIGMKMRLIVGSKESSIQMER